MLHITPEHDINVVGKKKKKKVDLRGVRNRVRRWCAVWLLTQEEATSHGEKNGESVAKQKWMTMMGEPPRSQVMDLLPNSCPLNT